jgi:phenylalanyl-tRNA synthetase beta subunit
MAVRLTLNSEEGTLNETQIEAVVQAVLTSLTNALAARHRS